MTQPKSVLTDNDINDFFDQFQSRHFSDLDAMGYALARGVEQAVLAKLAEQEPIGYLHANEISFLSAKGVTAEQARTEDYNISLYAHPSVSPINGCLDKRAPHNENTLVGWACENGKVISHEKKMEGVSHDNKVPLGISDYGIKAHHRNLKSRTADAAKILEWFDAHSKKINWGASFLDADAISSLNEILAGLRQSQTFSD